MNPDRYYINLVKKIISEGQKKGEIRTDISVEELAHDVLVLERGIIMDWCVQNGSFSLGYYGSRSFDLYIEFMRVGLVIIKKITAMYLVVVFFIPKYVIEADCKM